MTLKALLGAAGIAAVALAAAPVSAQTVTTTTRTTSIHREEGPRVAIRHHRRKVCTVRWVHHRKVRRCTWR